MIAARHKPWAEWIFAPYVDHILKRNFHALHLIGNIPEIPARYPLLLLPNHSTWWDGFFLHLLNRKLFNRRIYLMMLEAQLSRFPFFAQVGAFGIDPERISEIRSALNYCTEVLRMHTESDPFLLCLFPQGALQPWKDTDLTYKAGFLSIIRRSGVSAGMIQMAVKAVFLEEQYPEVFFMFGEPEIVHHAERESLASYKNKHECLLNQLDCHIREGAPGVTLLQGRRSASEKNKRAGWI